MKRFEILPGNDKHGHRWAFCYLHGKAEDVLPYSDDCAPDIFSASIPMPTEPGLYPCTILGQLAIAVVEHRYGTLGGRVALVSDPVSMEHALTSEDWL